LRHGFHLRSLVLLVNKTTFFVILCLFLSAPSHKIYEYIQKEFSDIFRRFETTIGTVVSTPSTGWPRPIGCLKLQVIFLKRATIYRALLRKITYKDMASYGSSTPCIQV
jgi:hypothetical protein